MRRLLFATFALLTATAFGQTDWKQIEVHAQSGDLAVKQSLVDSLAKSRDKEAIPILDRLAWDKDRKLADKALLALDQVLTRRKEEKERLQSGKIYKEWLQIYERYQTDRRYWRYLYCEPYLKDVRDAYYSGEEAQIAAQLSLLATKTSSNDDPPKSDLVGERCVTGIDQPSDNSMELLVEKRPDIARKLVRDPKTRIRSALMWHLSKLRDRQDVPLIELLYASPNITLRSAAVRAVHEVFYPELYPLVLKATADRSVIVRHSSIRPLRRFAGPDTIDAICRLLEDKNDQVAIQAVGALEDFTSPKFDPVILRLLNSDDAKSIELGLSANAHHSVVDALPRVVELLDRKDQDHWLVVRSLAAIKDPSAVQQVIALATDSKRRGRAAAIDQLPKLGDIGIQTFLALLGDSKEDPESLKRMIDTACTAELVSAAPLLNRLRKHADIEVREAADFALKQLGLTIIDP